MRITSVYTMGSKVSIVFSDVDKHIETMKPVFDVCLCNPVTDKFTTFEIAIQTSNPAFTLRRSRTRRRYNDFCWLKKALKSHHPMCTVPELPAKKTSQERFEAQFIVQRMKELGDWIYKTIDESLYLSDTTVHLFLQTNLTCKQIDQYIHGQLTSDVVDKAYRHCEDIEASGYARQGSIPGVPGGLVQGATASLSVETRHRSSLSDNQHRSDSGFASQIITSESDFESSSYESSNSFSNSNSYDSAVNESYPPLTQVSTSPTVEDQSVGKNCENEKLGTSQDSGHVIQNGGNHGDIYSEKEKTMNSLKTLEAKTEELDIKSDNTKTSHRVEKGVIFSINSG